MKGVNDSDRDVDALTDSIDPRWIVKFNPLIDDGGPHKPSLRTDVFLGAFYHAGLNAIAFNSVGSKIGNGLYGQLTHAKNNRIA